mgnify:CR=1 FL=1
MSTIRCGNFELKVDNYYDDEEWDTEYNDDFDSEVDYDWDDEF